MAALAALSVLAAPARPARADSVAALQARVEATAAEIHQFTSRYSAAASDAAALAQQLAVLQTALHRLQAVQSRQRAGLANLALDSFTGATATPVPVADLHADPAVQAEYLSLAVGGVTDQLDAYSLRQRELTAVVRTIRVEAAADRRAAAAASAARQQALAAAAAAQAELAALQAAAAAAHARAAAQGPPVGGGLVSVVRSETAPVAPAPAAVTAPAAPSVTAPRVTAPPVTTPPVTTPATTAPPATAPPTTPPTTAPPPTAPPTTAAPSPPTAPSGGVWLELRQCESGDNYQADTGNGYYGAYQFSEATWTGLGYPGFPNAEPPAMQDQAAQRLQAADGWGQWPACAAALGLS